jgi:hypothetical protein
MNDQNKSPELIDPKQAHKAAIRKNEVEDRSKMRLKSEKVVDVNGKRLKKLFYERNENGAWVKDHSKTIYLGKTASFKNVKE